MADSTEGTRGAFRRAMTEELIGAQRDYNAAVARQIAWRHEHPSPPATRRHRLKARWYWWRHDARTAIAQRIAPWLGDD